MRPINFKGRCFKRNSKKCEEVVRTYDKVQEAYAHVLERDEEILSFNCNVQLEDIEEGKMATDFVCTKNDGEIVVRECVYRKKLLLPRTCKLLDESRLYWRRRGVIDWLIVVEEVGENDGKE